MGVSTSSGRLPTTRATLSRTSLAAASTSRLSTNSISICERSSRDFDVTVLMPSMPATASSSTWVTWLSIIWADAPLYRVTIETVGGSMSGYSRIARRSNAKSPKIIRTRLTTVAKTGRLIDTSDRTIAQSPGRRISWSRPPPARSPRSGGSRLLHPHGLFARRQPRLARPPRRPRVPRPRRANADRAQPGSV